MRAVDATDTDHPGAWRPVSTRGFALNRNAASWAYLCLTAIAALVLGSAAGNALASLAPLAALLHLAVWAAWGGLAYALVCRADLNWSVPGRVRLAALAWGVFCLAYSGPVSSWLDNALPAVGPWVAAGHGPVAEEVLKLLGVALIAVVVPPVFGRPLGALLVGMLVGLGFTIVENLGRTSAQLEVDRQASVLDMLLRLGVYGAPWAHILFTGVAALGVWYVAAHRERPIGARIAVAGAFLVLAWALHLLQNALAPAPGSAVAPDLAAVGFWGAQLGLLLALVAWARAVDRAWFRSLGQHGLPPVMDETEAASLTTRRSRRNARQAGAARDVQNAQLRYVNAVSDGDDSTAEDMRHRVRLLRIGAGGDVAEPSW